MDGFHDIRADQAEPGDMIDLKHDPYADPEDRANIFPYELAVVENVERETPDCIRIDFNYTSIGFPPSHTLHRQTD